jgi:cation transport ATPase
MTPLFHDRLNVALVAISLIGLVSGLGLCVVGKSDFANVAWAAGVIPVLAALLVEIVRSLFKGEVGLDIVAALSMSAALLFGESLAAAVVALMYSGGTFLESLAEGRARREMSDLLSRVPRTATRHRNGALDEVPLDDIALSDLLYVPQHVEWMITSAPPTNAIWILSRRF